VHLRRAAPTEIARLTIGGSSGSSRFGRQRSNVNSLWHIDIKGPFFVKLERQRYLKIWIFGLVDDPSRYVLALRTATTRQVAPIAHLAARLHRVVRPSTRPHDRQWWRVRALDAGRAQTLRQDAARA
jgi:hypothetical protein